MARRSRVAPPPVEPNHIAVLREDRGVGDLGEHRAEHREALRQIAEDLGERAIVPRSETQGGEGMVGVAPDALVVLRSNERALEALGKKTAKGEAVSPTWRSVRSRTGAGA